MRIGIDVDDVVADLHTAWLNRYNAEYGTSWVPDDMTQWDFENDLGCTTEQLSALLTPGIYMKVMPIHGAYAAVEMLRDLGHEIHFVTSCRDVPMYSAKEAWLHKYGFLKDDSTVVWPVGKAFTHETKATVPVDLLVDDSIANVTNFPKAAYLVTRPHNRNHLCTRKRVKELMDVVPMVKYMKPVEVWPVPATDSRMPDADTVAAIEASVVHGVKPSNPKDLIGSDKLPFHLWPETASAHGALALLDGALKYGRSNFRAIGVRSSIYVDAARRHLNAWFEGEDYPPDSDCHHLDHALACLAVVIDAMEAGKLNDDRQVKGGYNEMVTRLTPLVKKIKERHAGKSPKHYTIADNAALSRGE